MEYGILRLGPTLIPTHSHVYTQGIGRDLLSRAHTLTHAHTHTYTHEHTHTHTTHTRTHTHTNNPEIQKARRPHVIVALLGYDADGRTHTHSYEPDSEGIVTLSLCLEVWSMWLQCVASCCSVMQRVAFCCSVFQCVSVCCSVLQCITVCCSVLHWMGSVPVCGSVVHVV